MQEINLDKQSKNNLHLCGIYMIKNLVNDKVYIGMTRKSFVNRLSQHINILNSQNHYNKHLQNSFNKHGANSFEFIILEVISKEENNLRYFLDRESDFINYHNALSKNGYNIAFCKKKHLDLSEISERFLSTNIREAIETILHKKNVESKLINTLLSLETVGEMIEYFYDSIAENESEFYGFVYFLDKHITKRKTNWKLDSFSLDTCRDNECIALDDFNNYCKFYECNIKELNYLDKKQCNYGDDYIQKVVDEYIGLRESWN